VEVEVLKETPPDRLAGDALEEHVVGQHHRRLPVGRQDGHDVLQEVQLLLRVRDEEVGAIVVVALAVGLAVLPDDAVALLAAEGRVRQDDLVGARARRQQRVLGLDD
jgi:hypothetical protein